MSRPKHYVVYVPGLGDVYDSGRKLALKTWRLYGVRAELVRMNWDDEKGYTPKYNRVVKAVTSAIKNGYTVSLVADSAGASLALNVFADYPDIYRVVTICGVNSPKLKISDIVKQKDPALDDSVKHLMRSLPKLDTKRIVSLQSRMDEIVADEYSFIKGARNQKLPIIGHSLAISFCLTFGTSIVVRAIKR